MTARGQRALRALIAFVTTLHNPPRRMTRNVGEAVREGFADNFADESSGAGGWAQLAPSTVEDRIRQGFPGAHPILERTGDYRRSFVDEGDPDHIHRVRVLAMQGWEMEEGSNDPRVAWLEGGTTTIPPRPVTILTRGAERRVYETLDTAYRAHMPEGYR